MNFIIKLKRFVYLDKKQLDVTNTFGNVLKLKNLLLL